MIVSVTLGFLASDQGDKAHQGSGFLQRGEELETGLCDPLVDERRCPGKGEASPWENGMAL